MRDAPTIPTRRTRRLPSPATTAPVNIDPGHFLCIPRASLHEGACMRDDEIRAALRRHWAASDASDFAAEHRIYEEHAVLDYPQSGERIRGRTGIQASRMAQPNKKHFAVQRVLGSGSLWISEVIATYDGQPLYVVSIMEFEGGRVVSETQYFGEPFKPGPSRAQWVEPVD